MSIFDIKQLHESPLSGITRWECGYELTNLILNYVARQS